MTPRELRQWAVEQAIASYGVEGCASDYNLEQRIERLLRFVQPETPSKEQLAKELTK